MCSIISQDLIHMQGIKLKDIYNFLCTFFNILLVHIMLQVDVWLEFERAEMQMIRWMCGISLKYRMTNEE